MIKKNDGVEKWYVREEYYSMIHYFAQKQKIKYFENYSHYRQEYQYERR